MKSLFVSRTVNRLSLGRIKYGWWSSQFTSDSSPVVIGGCGRSGTTLLRAMLNAHKHIAIGVETGVFCGNRDVDHLAEAFAISRGELQLHLRASACLGEFVERVMQDILSRSGKIRWGEKSPRNVQNIDVIMRYFPKAKFIHLIRDGRDVVCSLRHHPKYRWEAGERVPTEICNSWSSCVDRWVNDTEAGLRWRGDDRYLEIRYEDLVAHPEQQLVDLLDWLGEEWDPNVLDFHRQHEERCSDVANPGVKSEIYQSKVSRWQSELTTEARNGFSRRACDLLIQLGYASDDTWLRT